MGLKELIKEAFEGMERKEIVKEAIAIPAILISAIGFTICVAVVMQP